MMALVYNPTPLRWAVCKAIGQFWPGVFWSGLSSLSYRDVPVPELPTDHWVRLRTRLGGICGTDLGLIFHKTHPATVLRSLTSFPVTLGHENVAVIDALGSAVTGWQVGQRVCVEPAMSCVPRGIEPLCLPCARGHFSMCENTTGGPLPKGTMLGLNAFTSGSWAPYFVAHHSQLHAVPDALTDEQAVLVDPLACALHAVLRRVPEEDERVLIMGAGIIGLGVAASLRALGCGCRITALVRHRQQADHMRAAGASDVLVSPRSASNAERYEQVAAATSGRRIPSLFGHQGLVGGFDVAYECVGSGRGLTDCMHFVRARGTVVEVGTTHIGTVDTTPLWLSELTVLGAYGRQIESYDGRRQHTYGVVLELLAEGKLNADGWLSRTYRPAQYRQVLHDLSSRERMQIIKAAFMHDV
jgi:threonine dehydrogenase-like Zn-dependent dehydrogenase